MSLSVARVRTIKKSRLIKCYQQVDTEARVPKISAKFEEANERSRVEAGLNLSREESRCASFNSKHVCA